MSPLIALSDWFLNRATFRTIRDRIRGRTFILIVSLALLTNSFLGLLLADLQADNAFHGLILSQITCLFILLAYTKISGRYRLAAAIHFVVVHIHVCLVMLKAQSLFSIYYASMGTRVVVATFILGFRWAVPLILFYGITTVAIIHVNAMHGFQLPYTMTMETFATLFTMSLILAQLAMVFFSWLYHESLQQDYGRLKRDRARLFRSSRTLDLSRMLGELNHHINNPLSIIHAVLYRERLRPGTLVSAPEHPSTQAMHKIRFIVDHLKVLASPESPEEETRISVRNLCLNLLTHFQEPFRLKAVDFRFEDQTMNVSFRWQRHELFTTLAGLLQNACEAVAGTQRRQVTLRIERRDVWLLFSVIDSGPGMSDIARARVFKPFFSTKSHNSHLGLTLVTSRAQLEDRGGFITCETSTMGTSFVVGVPFQA